MSRILEIMKHGKRVEFTRCADESLWYLVTWQIVDVDKGLLCDPEDLEFRIPFADTSGATFLPVDTNVRYYMRWIRKQLEANQAQELAIAKAREEWKP